MQKIFYFSYFFSMNNLTLLISQIAGPIFLAIGTGMLFNNAHYATFYKDLKNEKLAIFGFALSTMTLGIIILLKHNLWNTTPEIIVTLIGWGALIKGISLLTLPTLIEKFTNNLPLATILSSASLFSIILGGYLTWFAYLA